MNELNIPDLDIIKRGGIWPHGAFNILISLGGQHSNEIRNGELVGTVSFGDDVEEYSTSRGSAEQERDGAAYSIIRRILHRPIEHPPSAYRRDDIH